MDKQAAKARRTVERLIRLNGGDPDEVIVSWTVGADSITAVFSSAEWADLIADRAAAAGVPVERVDATTLRITSP